MRASLPILLVSLASLPPSIGCGGSDGSGVASPSPATAPAADLNGVWAGTWLSARGQGGTLTATFTQVGAGVEGDLELGGSPCFAGGHLTGTLDGRDLAGIFVAGGARAAMSATVGPTSTSGTYDVASGGACSDDTGTFMLRR